MRLMLIDDDPRYRTLLRHHISCAWPDVDLVSYNPRVRGPLTPGFLAQGYSVVLLDHAWKGGSGLDWLKDFHGREGFAPVIFLSAEDESPDAVEARATGAFEVIGKTKIKHTKLNDAIRRAADEQAKAQSRWRMSAGREDGAGLRRRASQGIPAHRAHREGFGVGAVPRRKRHARRRGGAQGHARHPQGDRRRSVDGAVPAGIRDAARDPPSRTSCASTISASPTITCSWRWSISRAATCASACPRGSPRGNRWRMRAISPTRCRPSTKSEFFIATSSPAT